MRPQIAGRERACVSRNPPTVLHWPSSSGFAVAAASAGTITIATFADTAADSSTPVFTLAGDQFQGGWSSTGLNLLTPGLCRAHVFPAPKGNWATETNGLEQITAHRDGGFPRLYRPRRCDHA